MSKKKRSATKPEPTGPLERLAAWFERPNREVDVTILILLALITLIVFANILNGAFVYDDTRQILQNPVVRDRDLFWDALTSDVWAFKSGGTEAVSDYWRPLFVFWLVLNERLFGVENTAGWHIANLVLHVATAVLAYLLLRKLKLNRPITTAIVLVFLLHPSRVETVSWISGSPDLLMALPILGACLLLLNHMETADLKEPHAKTQRPQSLPDKGYKGKNLRLFSGKAYIAAVFLFALAILAKEAAILFPLLVFLLVLLWSGEEQPLSQAKILRAGRYALPFIVVALLYLAARVAILGQLFSERPWQQPLLNVLLTLPSVVVFYLRQALLPIVIGPSYPLRVIGPENLTPQNFGLPLVILLVVTAALFWLARRSAVKLLGLALFFLFLLPAFNINAFHPEQIVHDRYLYLPLLGLLIVVVLSLNDAARWFNSRLNGRNWTALQFGVLTLLVTAVLTLPLAVQTIRYNTAWKSDLALWTWGVQTDPESILSAYQYGYFSFRAGEVDQAKEAMDGIIARQPLSGPYYRYFQVVEAYLERADIAIRQEELAAAREDLAVVLDLSPANLSESERENLEAQQRRAIERLALSYIQENDYETAVAVLEDGRERLPQLACTFTTNLAVSLYLSGQKDRALTELESVQERVNLEYTPLCKMSLFYLGQLYLEAGKTAEARSKLTAFLAASEPFFDSQTINLQNQARQLLGQISGS